MSRSSYGDNNTKSSNHMNKSNFTLWKSKNGQHSFEEDKKIEGEYIDNLKKQVHFMEMELKLLNEREKEIEKTGGFTQLFNDDKDPSQHILQLKQKYATMRKKQEVTITDLNKRQKEVHSVNETLKSKLGVLKKFEKEMYDKLMSLEEKSSLKLQTLEEDLYKQNKDRVELEANNRLKLSELNNQIQESLQLENYILSNTKSDVLVEEHFNLTQTLLEKNYHEKIKDFERITLQIKELEKGMEEEPVFKIELDKNGDYKKRLEKLETQLLSLDTQVEILEMTNEYLIKKKEDAVTNRKKLINTTDEQKREIESKIQLNEVRIQKKVKDNNSEEIQKLETHLDSVKKTIAETEEKIQKEMDKTKMFSLEIIKLNLETIYKTKCRETVMSSVDTKLVEIEELNDQFEELKAKHLVLKERIAKESVDHQLLRNRNKILMEEFTGTQSRYTYIQGNNDYTSNLRKISMEDLKNVSTTNNLVNDTLANFASKVGAFKKNNLASMLDK